MTIIRILLSFITYLAIGIAALAAFAIAITIGILPGMAAAVLVDNQGWLELSSDSDLLGLFVIFSSLIFWGAVIGAFGDWCDRRLERSL